METKKGMASLFLVAFMTLLIGIIVLSFTQLVTSELRAASNSDLSQSAYDAALAGIEDAKTAIVKYQACKAKNSEPEECRGENGIVAKMERGMAEGSCGVVADVLGRTDNGEVLIQAGEDEEEGNVLDEAYTCLKVNTTAANYNSYLSASSTSRIVPVVTAGEEYKDVVGVKLEWYSGEAAVFEENLSEAEATARREDIFSNVYTTLDGTDDVFRFDTVNNVSSTYPVVTFDLFQTDDIFSAYQLDVNNDENNGTDHAMLTLYPQNTTVGDNGTYITARQVLNASDKTSSGPVAVACGYKSGYRCRSTIRFPATYNQNTESYVKGAGREKTTFFFRVTLPYGAPSTDFTVTLCGEISDDGKCTEIINFNDVQAVVDSTGRASTLYRRVIAHIDLLDSGALPEFAVQQYNSSDTEAIRKDFYVTKDCFAGNNGNLSECRNTGS
ncbi:hypothetical protein IJ103_02480 [Candidatus Saccharibacteria bacterium]|nr:hypothetical protein [Candidatus Saccharibacteria bacterium]